jgi:ABC-type cobalamin/Fe3+-siderophores transport system ATPase subunit
MALLSAHSLQLSVNKKLILDDISLDIHANELVGLIGPNGAGKSSLLRIIAGLLAPSCGTVTYTLNDVQQPIAKIPAKQKAKFLAYLAQHETPAWPLDVRHLVALGRSPWQNYSRAHQVDTLAINNAMQTTEVAHLAERPITELSGGELQRVMLARVFAGRPQLIVADEPIASLDIYHQLHIMELLQIHAQSGGSVIAALHDLSLAARFCSRLLLIDNGKIVAQGKPIDVLTTENIAAVYGVNTSVSCNQEGIIIMPIRRIY